MPSPFPGMDPYLESSFWVGFHARLIVAMGDILVPRLRPGYLVDVQRYVFIEADEADDRTVIGPDVHLAETGHGWQDYAGAAVATIKPVRNVIPTPENKGQSYLVIRTQEHRRVVTVIELLSPTNKEPGKGLTQYLQKRRQYMRSDVSLVEIDLLRGGSRLPTEQPLQPGDYYAYVSPPLSVGQVDVYSWNLPDPLPTLPIPLARHDQAVPLDLQAAMNTVYDRGGYDYSLPYDEPLIPPLSPERDTWAKQILSRVKPLPAKIT